MAFALQHDAPNWSVWRMSLVCLLAYGIVVAVHVAEFPRWDQPELQLNGEMLLATNDGYAWVAGAEGALDSAARQPMAKLLAVLGDLSGIRPALLAFWLPAFLAALCVVPITLWARQLDAPMMALPASVLVGLAPAFYTRTRLGYFDTDWATMVFPLLIGWLLSWSFLGEISNGRTEPGSSAAASGSLHRFGCHADPVAGQYPLASVHNPVRRGCLGGRHGRDSPARWTPEPICCYADAVCLRAQSGAGLDGRMPWVRVANRAAQEFLIP